jgi:hypothetical protein
MTGWSCQWVWYQRCKLGTSAGVPQFGEQLGDCLVLGPSKIRWGTICHRSIREYGLYRETDELAYFPSWPQAKPHNQRWFRKKAYRQKISVILWAETLTSGIGIQYLVTYIPVGIDITGQSVLTVDVVQFETQEFRSLPSPSTPDCGGFHSWDARAHRTSRAGRILRDSKAKIGETSSVGRGYEDVGLCFC